jgi:PIN domain nuclease of toxin-antitoxin system
MPERFLLDSSALIAFLQAEPGAPRVLDLLVHKDPEFATVPVPLKQEMLPPKIPLPAAT